MYRGFPLKMIARLRCPRDGAALKLADAVGAPSEYILDDKLRCASGSHEFGIDGGIVRFLETAKLDAESENERQRRDEGAAGLDPAWESSTYNQMEIQPTIEASEPLPGALVLELGAGTGRYTAPMADRGASVLAVDFSGGSLANLAQRARDTWDIGLVQADCTELAVEPGAFDLVASTLMSNLPTAQHRAGVMRVAAIACKPLGKFVFGTHYHGLGSRLRGEAKSGYYREAPIYRYMFGRREIVAETRPHFADIDLHPIRIALPFTARLGLPILKLSRLTERVPLINQFGDLLLVVARQPLVRATV
jgi:SAM-dependent methyltransferase